MVCALDSMLEMHATNRFDISDRQNTGASNRLAAMVGAR